MTLTVSQVDDAAERIAPYVERTPVLRLDAIDELAGCRVHLKAEHLQTTGSFKARGAYNKLLRLTDDERRRGVVAVSSGNHAAAVACAGQTLRIQVEVYMPSDAPTPKRRLTADYGATIHWFDRLRDDRDELLRDHVETHGSVPVWPFDDLDVMAGQGTVALELLAQADIDTLVVPMSGGGLMAGCATVARARRPGVQIIGVEPLVADDTRRSFEAGRRIAIHQPVTIADGLAVRVPGELTFPINLALVDEVVTVTEEQIADTTVLLHARARQVVEPSGATALAAVLHGQVTGKDIGVVLSGGNIDPETLDRLTG